MKKLIAILFVLVFINVTAQQTSKEKLKIDDFASWKTIVGSSISNNGESVVFELNPQKGDGNLIIVNNQESDTIPRGNKAKISTNNDFVAFYIKQPDDKTRKAKLDKVKKEEMPKDSLGIYFLKEKSLIKYPKLKSFKLSEENTNWLAFVLENEKEKKDTAKKEESGKSKKEIKQPGDNLVLFKAKSKDTLLFKNVVEYSISKKGSAIYFVQQTKDSINTFSTLNVFNTETEKVTELFSSEGWLKKSISSEDGENYAFLYSKDTIDEKVYSLYAGNINTTLDIIVDRQTNGVPIGWAPSENRTIYFSRNNTKLFLGTAIAPEPEPKDSLLDEDKPKVDIWNWKDLKLQPQQKVEAEKEKKRTYLAVYHFPEQV